MTASAGTFQFGRSSTVFTCRPTRPTRVLFLGRRAKPGVQATGSYGVSPRPPSRNVPLKGPSNPGCRITKTAQRELAVASLEEVESNSAAESLHDRIDGPAEAGSQ
jgi:hypothetical protein